MIILDRDGVINDNRNYYVTSLNEWFPFESSITAIAKLYKNSINVAVATNQSGIGRGLYSRDDVDKIHAHLLQQVKDKGGDIDFFEYCYHHPEDNCHCRKPKSGMLKNIISRWKIAPENCYMVGDSLVDIQAAMEINVQPILVLTGKGKTTLEENQEFLQNIPVFENLSEFTKWFLTKEKNKC